jgi:hypothetical protein
MNMAYHIISKHKNRKRDKKMSDVEEYSGQKNMAEHTARVEKENRQKMKEIFGER